MAEKMEKKAEVPHRHEQGHDNAKAGPEEVIVMNPSKKRRSVPLYMAKKLLGDNNSGFTLVDAGEYAKELEEFLSGSKKK